MNPVILHTGPLSVNTLIIPLVANKVFIVDPASCAFSDDENEIIDYINQNNLEPVAIILTHGHFDHVSGLPFLKKNYPNIPILIHKNDAKMIGANSGVEQGQGLFLMRFNQFLPFVSNLPEPTDFLSDEKTLLECISSSNNFDDDLKIVLNDWLVIHTPGHTNGCVCLLNKKEKILISGDTIFYHSWGRTDLPDGNERLINESLKKVYNTISDDVKIYPGHDRFGFTKKD